MNTKLLKLFTILIMLFMMPTFAQAQVVRNPVLEYCTGTWCQWCPCGHTIIKNDILRAMNNAIILSYHGPANGSDPMSFFSGNSIISSLGFSGYPTGIADRTSAPQSRSAWFAMISNRMSVPATVDIKINKTYNSTTRTLDITIASNAQVQLSGQYKLNLILTEDGLVYNQTGNASCPGGSDYVHDNVVRGMINGALGEDLSTTTWNAGNIISKVYQHVVPSGMNASRCNIVAFVYKVGGSLNTSEIQQAEKWTLEGTVTSIGSGGNILQPEKYELSQNTPNPFNPSTKISFSVPSHSHVKLSVFDILGREINVLVNETKQPGFYEVDFNAANLQSGIYFYKLDAASRTESQQVFSKVKKMMLVK